MQEWQSVREEALKQVMERHAQQKTAPQVNMLGKTCDKRRLYILSAIPQDALIRRYHYKAVGLIMLFFACWGLATWMMNLRLNGV